jgi:hypothetical protein
VAKRPPDAVRDGGAHGSTKETEGTEMPFKIDPGEREWFTPSSQSDETEPFAIELRPLTGREKVTVWSRSQTDDTEAQIGAMYDVMILAATDWRNATASDGKPAPFEGRTSIESLPWDWVAEAYHRVIEMSTITPEQAGN